MLTRFLIWLYRLITLVSNEPTAAAVTKKLNSKVLDTLNEIVFKSMSAIEREEIISKTSILTEKLSNIVSNID